MTEEIFKGFAARGITRGNELYLRPVDALELLRTYDAHGIAVVGTEAAVLEISATFPVPELVADFSDSPAADWATFRRQCMDDCSVYLKELPKGENLYVTLIPLHEREI